MDPDYGAAKATNFDSIPVVSLTDIDTDAGFDRIAKSLIQAAKNVGFFYLSDHGIAQAQIDGAFAASKRFFDLPVAAKETIRIDQQQRGWMGQGLSNLEGSKTHDAKEVFFWGWDIAPDDPALAAGRAMVALNQWPTTVDPDLRNDLLPYYQAVVGLSRKVLSALAHGLGQDRNFFETAYQTPLGRGQMVYYPAPTSDDLKAERFGASTHSDFGVLTMLMQDQTGGLQVQNPSGEWIEAPPIAGTFVCNIGDLLERWTNHQLTSTKHRVLNRATHARYSIPIFCDPASETVIDPADFTLDGAQPMFEPVTAGEYIMGKNKKNFSHFDKKP